MEKISITLARLEKIKNLLECWNQKTSISNIERNIVLNLLSASYDDIFHLNSCSSKSTPTKVEETVSEQIQDSKVEHKNIEIESKAEVEKELEFVEPIQTPQQQEQPAQNAVKQSLGKQETNTTVRLGDKFSGLKKYLNDNFSNIDDTSIARYSSIDDINRAIGINDRFLFIKELFNGDKELFSKTISTLNSCSSIDEALMYLHQNFSWNSEDEAVKQLVLLLYRRFK